MGLLENFMHVVLGGANLARHATKNNLAGIENRRHESQLKSRIESELEKHYDPELETKVIAYIDNPDNYDTIWDFLEEKERKNRAFHKAQRSYNPTFALEWEYVATGRKPFYLKQLGTSYNYEDTKKLTANRYITLVLILETQGKWTTSYARAYEQCEKSNILLTEHSHLKAKFGADYYK